MLKRNENLPFNKVKENNNTEESEKLSENNN